MMNLYFPVGYVFNIDLESVCIYYIIIVYLLPVISTIKVLQTHILPFIGLAKQIMKMVRRAQLLVSIFEFLEKGFVS